MSKHSLNAAKLLAALLLVLALGACQNAGMGGVVNGAGYTGGNTAGASISGYAFRPSSVTFPGANMVTVTWTNNDTVTHTVTESSGTPAFDSGNVAPGQTYNFSFSVTVKTYTYHCSIHPYMTGTITVQ